MSTNSYSYVPYQVAQEENINLMTLLKRYLRQWKWFALSLVLALAGAYVYYKFQQPIYQIEASLLIKDEKKGISEENVLKELDIFTPKKVVENEIEILRSFTLMDRVVDQLHLDVKYYTTTPWGKREVYGDVPVQVLVEKPLPAIYKETMALQIITPKTVSINGKIYPLNQSIDTPYGRLRVDNRRPVNADMEALTVHVMPRVLTVNSYLDNLKVESTSKQSTVLLLSLEDAVPAKGEAVMTQLVEEYNKAAVLDKNKVASNTLKFIEDRLALISGELTTVEKNVELFKSAEGITDLGTQASLFLETVKGNDGQLSQIDMQLGALNDVEKYVKGQARDRGVAPATLGMSDPVLLGLVSKLNEMELKRNELMKTTSENNPLLVTIDSQIRSTRAHLDETLGTMRQVLTTSRQQLMAKNNRLAGMIRTVPRKERALLDVTRQQAIKNNLYTYLLQKREETALSYASTVSDSRTIDAARAGVLPVKPVKNTILTLFGILGLILPAGLLTAKDALSNRVMRRSDVEESTQAPIIGEVIENHSSEALVITPRSHTIIAEQIRTLRTNLQFLRSNPTDSQVLLFTSSISGEGKSFMSLNLAASLALVGRPTVILEMDLRKPKLHKALKMPNLRGISNYLIGESTLDEVLQPVEGYENMFLIACGPIPPNPSELLNSPRLDQLLRELRSRFSYVIIDSPPIGLVTDAQLLAPHADATLYVVRHDVTPKSYLKMVNTLYKEQRFQKLNLILNAVGDGDAYYYSYSYNDYYSDGAKPKQRFRLRRQRAES